MKHELAPKVGSCREDESSGLKCSLSRRFEARFASNVKLPNRFIIFWSELIHAGWMGFGFGVFQTLKHSLSPSSNCLIDRVETTARNAVRKKGTKVSVLCVLRRWVDAQEFRPPSSSCLIAISPFCSRSLQVLHPCRSWLSSVKRNEFIGRGHDRTLLALAPSFSTRGTEQGVQGMPLSLLFIDDTAVLDRLSEAEVGEMIAERPPRFVSVLVACGAP